MLKLLYVLFFRNPLRYGGESGIGLEPMLLVLQTSSLPFGYTDKMDAAGFEPTIFGLEPNVLARLYYTSIYARMRI